MMATETAALPNRTPPDIKWLLNERAALSGEVEKASLKQTALAHKQKRLEHQLEGILKAIERSKVDQARSQASLAALDATMDILNKQVNPGAGGTVMAWAGKYGARGGLRDFIAQVLESAAPKPVTTTVLMNLAARHFGLKLATHLERRSFNKSVSSALTGLHTRGLIEPRHVRTQGSHGLWRWGTTVPSIAELANAAQRPGGVGV